MANILKQLCECTDCTTITTPCGCGPYIWEHPVGSAICEGGETFFEGNVHLNDDEETAPDSYQWQIKAPDEDWEDIEGETSESLELLVLSSSLDGYQYRLVAFFGEEQTQSNAATLRVTDGSDVVITFTNQPDPVSRIEGRSASFTVGADASVDDIDFDPIGLSFQWQRSTGGGAFSDIAGATSPTYTIAEVSLDMDGDVFRCKVMACGYEPGHQNSDGAELTVTECVEYSGSTHSFDEVVRMRNFDPALSDAVDIHIVGSYSFAIVSGAVVLTFSMTTYERIGGAAITGGISMNISTPLTGCPCCGVGPGLPFSVTCAVEDCIQEITLQFLAALSGGSSYIARHDVGPVGAPCEDWCL